MNRRSKFWMFTINNPEADLEFDRLGVEYAIWQKEKGKEGTLHFQGYICFESRKRGSEVKKLAPFTRAHLEPRQGTHEQAKKYCSKVCFFFFFF